MLNVRFLGPLLLAALPAAAQTPEGHITPEAFREMVTGKTLFFDQQGQPAGAEAYRLDGSLTWTFPDGTCVEGGWYEDGDSICFAYVNDPGESLCWHFFEQDGELRGRIVGDDPDDDLTVVGIVEIPLPCVPPGSGI